MLSMSQAARWAGVSKATIHRAIKSGRISAARQDDGSYQIDPAELSRVYTMNHGNGRDETHEMDRDHLGETKRNPLPNGHNGPDTASAMIVATELAGARQLIKSLQEQVADLRNALQDQVEDLRRDRDGWRQQAETVQRLLTDATAKTAAARTWWRRLAEI